MNSTQIAPRTIDPIVAECGDQVIPAVLGEYYAYSSVFTAEKPVYVFLKCKSTKNRLVADISDLGKEVNLVFSFEKSVQVCSINDAYAVGMLEEPIDQDVFDTTQIAKSDISVEEFYDLRSQQDGNKLKSECLLALSGNQPHHASISLSKGDVIASVTSAGKYTMFVVKEVNSDAILIDACHILMA